jgi:hypothetical protein
MCWSSVFVASSAFANGKQSAGGSVSRPRKLSKYRMVRVVVSQIECPIGRNRRTKATVVGLVIAQMPIYRMVGVVVSTVKCAISRNRWTKATVIGLIVVPLPKYRMVRVVVSQIKRPIGRNRRTKATVIGLIVARRRLTAATMAAVVVIASPRGVTPLVVILAVSIFVIVVVIFLALLPLLLLLLLVLILVFVNLSFFLVLLPTGVVFFTRILLQLEPMLNHFLIDKSLPVTVPVADGIAIPVLGIGPALCAGMAVSVHIAVVICNANVKIHGVILFPCGIVMVHPMTSIVVVGVVS